MGLDSTRSEDFRRDDVVLEQPGKEEEEGEKQPQEPVPGPSGYKMLKFRKDLFEGEPLPSPPPTYPLKEKKSATSTSFEMPNSDISNDTRATKVPECDSRAHVSKSNINVNHENSSKSNLPLPPDSSKEKHSKSLDCSPPPSPPPPEANSNGSKLPEVVVIPGKLFLQLTLVFILSTLPTFQKMYCVSKTPRQCLIFYLSMLVIGQKFFLNCL